jgi:hypothetical protein
MPNSGNNEVISVFGRIRRGCSCSTLNPISIPKTMNGPTWSSTKGLRNNTGKAGISLRHADESTNIMLHVYFQ